MKYSQNIIIKKLLYFEFTGYTFKHQNKRNFSSLSLKLNNPLGIIIKADRRKGNARELIARENRPEIYFWREKTLIACLL